MKSKGKKRQAFREEGTKRRCPELRMILSQGVEGWEKEQAGGKGSPQQLERHLTGILSKNSPSHPRRTVPMC